MLAAALAFAAALVQTVPAQGASGGVATPAVQAQATAAETPATAETTPPSPTAEPEKPRMICRSEQITGTRFPIRRCRSAQQSAAESAEGQDMLNRMNGSRNDPHL